MDNINIWFARNKEGNIVTIDKINDNNRYEEYSCPICESKLIPKLGDVNAHHLAHKDASKCSRETQIHFFVKNELLKQGDKFTVKLDDESKEFVCKEILIEQEYKTEFGIYKPDITIITEDNKTIYFEVAHTNKKKIEDYLDIWIELNNIVVEIETKEMIEGKTITEFEAKFYEGKCFNIRQEDKDYYELIGKIKLNNTKYPKEQVEKLNWLWVDINKYLLGEIEISEISDIIQAIENEELQDIVVSVLRKNRCTGIVEDYIKYNIDKSLLKLNNQIPNCSCITDKCRLWNDRIYYGYKLTLKYKDILMLNEEINYSDTNNIEELIKDEYLNYIKLDKYVRENYSNYTLNFSSNYRDEKFISLIENKFDLEYSYNEGIKFIDKEVIKNEEYTRKLGQLCNNIETINQTLYNTYENISNIKFSDDKRIMHFDYKYYSINKSYSFNTYLHSDVEYYSQNIIDIIKKDFKNIICDLIKKDYENLNCSVMWNEKSIYIKYLDSSVPIKIDFNFNVDKEYINNIVNRYYEKINICEEYSKIFKDYYYKSLNAKNNYYITLLDYSLNIYYKQKCVESIKYFEIENINEILDNNEYLRLSILDNIEDYYNFEIFNNIVDKINLRYHKVDGYWRILYQYEKLKLYKNNEFVDFIDIPDNFDYEDDLFMTLINKISHRIRAYLYN